METGPLLPKIRAGELSGPNAPSLSISTLPLPLLVISLPSCHMRYRPGAQPQTHLCPLYPFPSLLLCQLTLGELAKGRDLVLVVSGLGPSIEFVPLRRSANTCWDKMAALGWAAGLGGVESAASQLSRTAGCGAGQGPWTSRRWVPITGGEGQGAGRPQPHSHPGPLFSGLSSLHPSFSFPPDAQRQWKRVRGSFHASDHTRLGRWGSCPLTGKNFRPACSRDWGRGMSPEPLGPVTSCPSLSPHRMAIPTGLATDLPRGHPL